jgi:Tol biopolymer transport system component
MNERWQTRLRALNELEPDDDLFERALSEPREPTTATTSSRAAVIAVALIVPLALIAGAVFLLRDGAPLSSAAGSTGTSGPAPVTRTNGDLLYAKRVDNGWSLFTLDPDTGTERQITQGYRDYGSDWSPDGRQIVYDSEQRGGGQGIWIANADGSDAHQLVEEGSVPVWSPDGTTIAFAGPDVGRMVQLGDGSTGTPSSIYVMDPDGTNVRQLTHGEFADYSPTWSPDGTQIAFKRQDANGGGVFVMNADGSEVHAIYSGGGILWAPAWGPDGRIALAAVGTNDGPPGGIVLMEGDGSGATTTVAGTETAYPDYVANPTWSPDGQFIAYVNGYRGEIVVVRPDGSDRHTLKVPQGDDSIEALSWGSG